MTPLLSVRNLKKIYGRGCPNCLSSPPRECQDNRCPRCAAIIACSDISFDVVPGEVLGIVGESGSGKSTILNCINLTLSATGGQIFYGHFAEGTRDILMVDAQTRRTLQNIHFGIVYQNPQLGLNFQVSGEGNVAERMLVAGHTHFGQIQTNVHQLLQRVELPPSRYKDLPNAYSGGMQQRVQIAKALINEPAIILLDEPTGGLDVSVQARILDLIRSISREFKVAMVMVSHDMQVIRLLCQRIIVMKHGRIIESGLTDRVIDDPREAYTQTLVHSTIQ
ncbi:MAG: ATP-binding cassette domain-containing protein [Desulfosarcinaceae bacterium]|nr:ATP-binding cassette domain-containing protein [Desulfosarcinaceae bacterium]